VASGKSKVLWFIAAVAVFFVAFRIFPSARAARASEVLDVTRLNANLTDAEQLVIVRTSTDAENAGTLTTYEKDRATGIWHSVLGPITAHIGRNGFSAAHHEGDGTTPTGIFTLSQMFGRNQDPGVRFPYRQIGPQDWWVSDATSPYYNTWQVGPPSGWNPAAGEHLSDSNYAVAYRYATVIDYNRSPVVPGNGSAIFLHVGSKPTSGCVDIAESDLVSVMRWLDPTKKPQILMGSDNTLLAPDQAPDVTALLSPTPVGFAAVTPHRVLDTRTGLGHAGPLGPGQTLDLPVTTDPQLGDATAVVLNLTIVGPTQPTYLQAYPTPAGTEAAPTFSSLNAAAGDQRAGLVIVRVGAGGSVRIGNYAGTTHVVADVVGFA
jgi:L,D-peptidoglycan transpeptidase YkuD (ErfK/YbiS/YcfS/YnhG family)